MEEDFSIYEGIIDKENNPFSCRSWREECNAGNPIGSGKEFQDTAKRNFKLFLDKSNKISDAKNRHTEKYACFQAIRWEPAIVKNGTIYTTEKWKSYNPVLSKNEMGASFIKNVSRVKHEIHKKNKKIT